MEDVLIALAYFLGRISKIVLVSTIYTVIVGAIVFIPCRKRHYWRIVISAWFLFFAWQVFKITTGQVYLNTFSRPQASFVGSVFFSVVATTPLVLFALLKKRLTRWIYAICVFCVVGLASPILDLVFAAPAATQTSGPSARSAAPLPEPGGYIQALRAQWEQEAQSAGVTFASQGEYREHWQNRLEYEYMNLRETYDHNRKKNLRVNRTLRDRLLQVLTEMEGVSAASGNEKSLKWIRQDKAEITTDRDSTQQPDRTRLR